MKIYLDFDGTVVEHEYPKMGRENVGCMAVIKKLQDAGHEIILNTYRADCANGTLERALSFLRYSEVEIRTITVVPNKIHPWIWNWDDILAHQIMFIDDQAPNIPLKDAVMTSGKMVDWKELDQQFQERGLYS